MAAMVYAGKSSGPGSGDDIPFIVGSVRRRTATALLASTSSRN